MSSAPSENKKVEEAAPLDFNALRGEYVRASLTTSLRLADGRVVVLRLELLGPRPSGTSFADTGGLELEALAEAISVACPTVKNVLEHGPPDSKLVAQSQTAASSQTATEVLQLGAPSRKSVSTYPTQPSTTVSTAEELKARDGASLATIVKTKD